MPRARNREVRKRRSRGELRRQLAPTYWGPKRGSMHGDDESGTVRVRSVAFQRSPRSVTPGGHRCERERKHQLREAAVSASEDAAAPKSSFNEVSYGLGRRRWGTRGARWRSRRCEREGKHQLREAAGGASEDAAGSKSSFNEGDNRHRRCQTAKPSMRARRQASAA